MNNKLKLIWSLTQEPDEKVHYNHVYAETPFGRILITWKGWKEYPAYDIEEMPGYDDNYMCRLNSCDTESAKIEAEEKYVKWLEEAYKESQEKTVNLAIELIKYKVK